MKTIKEIIDHCERIASLNSDSFSYKFDANPSRHGLSFSFTVEEEADGHALLGGDGDTPEAAANEAYSGLEDACKEWSYKYCS